MNILELANLPLLLSLLLIVAFLYASVGHGGASGYLALMTAFAFPVSFMKPTALLLNILVAGVSFSFYQRNNNFKWKLFYPFVITSIPFSFLGGLITINTHLFKIILAIVLVFAVARLLGLYGKEATINKPIILPLALVAGAIIGLLSGLLGIGGGIILTPLLILLGWANYKEAAAVSALFILVNSVSGILGFLAKGETIPSGSSVLIIVAFVGGTLGAYYGSKKFNTLALRNILAVVLCIAIFKLFTTA